MEIGISNGVLLFEGCLATIWSDKGINQQVQAKQSSKQSVRDSCNGLQTQCSHAMAICALRRCGTANPSCPSHSRAGSQAPLVIDNFVRVTYSMQHHYTAAVQCTLCFNELGREWHCTALKSKQLPQQAGHKRAGQCCCLLAFVRIAEGPGCGSATVLRAKAGAMQGLYIYAP